MNLLNLFNGQPKIFDVSSVKYKKPIDQQLVDKLISYIRQSFKKPAKIMVGIDESTNCLTAAQLLKQALGENVAAMVFEITNPIWTNSSVELCQQLGLESYILKRGASYQSEISAFGLHNPSHIRHFYKRFINYHLQIQAEHMKAKVVDTLDKSDRLLDTRPEGFYGHCMPFYSLYKSELYDLAAYLGIPSQFINAPSGYQDLLYPESKINLTWDKIDPVLYLLTEKQLKAEDISKQYNIDIRWLRSLNNHVNRQLFQTTISQLII